MSIAVRTSRAPLNTPSTKVEEPIFLTGHPNRSAEGEAPDAGYVGREAPERGSRRREEPDAGYSFNESQAFHGRSRS